MDSIKFENLLKEDIEQVFIKILENCDYTLNISAKSRSGAEISDYLEDRFVEYITQNPHERISKPLGAPKGATKNPYDFMFNYDYKDDEVEYVAEPIWADIKACKHTYDDSNPDIGTPKKVIKYMLDGHFYLMYVLFSYISTDDDKTKFIKLDNGKYVKVIFLKNIHHSVRVNPKPQLQVNINEPEEYRTEKEFVELLETKYYESLDRIIKNVEKTKATISKQFKTIKENMEK